MTTVQDELRTRGWPSALPWPQREDRTAAAHERLDRARTLAPRLEFDDSSRLVFFSDVHRGDNGPSDAFRANKALFMHALTHYFRQGFSYLEVGDGDELWHAGSFERVRQAHARVFDLLEQFRSHGRLHLIVGNHDSTGAMFDPVEKDGIPVHPGIMLQHANTNQQIFAVHGHQADQSGDRYWGFSRLHSRYVWRHLLALGLDAWHHVTSPDPGLREEQRLQHLPRWMSDWFLGYAHRVDARVREWARERRQLVVSGHTHLAQFPDAREPHHFNLGSCVNPGFMTGLELENGRLTLVKWSAAGRGVRREPLKSAPLAAYRP